MPSEKWEACPGEQTLLTNTTENSWRGLQCWVNQTLIQNRQSTPEVNGGEWRFKKVTDLYKILMAKILVYKQDNTRASY